MVYSRSTRPKPKEKRRDSISIGAVGVGNRRATLTWGKRERWKFTILAAQSQRFRRKRGRSSRDDVLRGRASHPLGSAERWGLGLVPDFIFGGAPARRRNRF